MLRGHLARPPPPSPSPHEEAPLFDHPLKNWLLADTGAAGRFAIQLGKDRRGVTAIEYSLMAALAVVALLGGGATLFGDISQKFSAIGSNITAGS